MATTATALPFTGLPLGRHRRRQLSAMIFLSLDSPATLLQLLFLTEFLFCLFAFSFAKLPCGFEWWSHRLKNRKACDDRVPMVGKGSQSLLPRLVARLKIAMKSNATGSIDLECVVYPSQTEDEILVL